MNTLLALVRDVFEDIRQRYAVAWLLDDLRHDGRRLEDLGLCYAELERALWHEHRKRSLLRARMRQWWRTIIAGRRVRTHPSQ